MYFERKTFKNLPVLILSEFLMEDAIPLITDIKVFRLANNMTYWQ